METKNLRPIMSQITSGRFEVNHAGTSAWFTNPEYTQGLTREILLDEELLTDFCRKAGVLHKMLHTGFQQELVNWRAIPRRKDKAGDQIPFTPALVEKYQKEITAYLPKLMPDPAATKAGKAEPTPEKALEVLLKGMTPEQLMSKLQAMTAGK